MVLNFFLDFVWNSWVWKEGSFNKFSIRFFNVIQLFFVGWVQSESISHCFCHFLYFFGLSLFIYNRHIFIRLNGILDSLLTNLEIWIFLGISEVNLLQFIPKFFSLAPGWFSLWVGPLAIRHIISIWLNFLKVFELLV